MLDFQYAHPISLITTLGLDNYKAFLSKRAQFWNNRGCALLKNRHILGNVQLETGGNKMHNSQDNHLVTKNILNQAAWNSLTLTMVGLVKMYYSCYMDI